MLCAVFSVMVAFVAAAQSEAAEPTAANLIAAAGFPEANLGYVVVSLADGRVKRVHQVTNAFIPASMVKLATAFAGLEVLGAEHRFSTPIYAVERPDGLHLHLSGGGDPVLVQEDMQRLATSLARQVAGFRIAGFTYDSDGLPFISAIDPSDDIANSYNPPVAALSVNFNRQWLRWERAPDHFAMLVSMLPDLGQAAPGVAAIRASDGRPVQVLDGLPTRFLIEPRVPSKGQRRVAVRRPALRAAMMVQRYAVEAGVVLPLPTQGARPAEALVLTQVSSRPMTEIAAALMKFSNNLSAELVGLAVANKLGQRPGTLREGAATVRAWVGERVPAMTGDGMQWSNQSGLSGEARLSPLALLSLLQHAGPRAFGDQRFLDLLHEPRWSERDPTLTIRAKSGTMSYARGQAGLLITKDGREFLFVLMHTDFDARARFEAHPQRFANPIRRQAGRWVAQARVLEQALLRHWAKTL
jgi:D-alanyl-D-alanine carboxypeptidase/D-alanyl-D-alanine-endopeptidase (penicillin-binding protein 4)